MEAENEKREELDNAEQERTESDFRELIMDEEQKIHDWLLKREDADPGPVSDSDPNPYSKYYKVLVEYLVKILNDATDNLQREIERKRRNSDPVLLKFCHDNGTTVDQAHAEVEAAMERSRREQLANDTRQACKHQRLFPTCRFASWDFRRQVYCCRMFDNVEHCSTPAPGDK